MNDVVLYLGSAVTAVWGIAHLSATRGVVRGFGELTADNRRIITMEWIVEGLALLSTAAFVAVATAVGSDRTLSSAVHGVAVATLVALAGVWLATGFRIAVLPFRLCPFIVGGSAALIAVGAWW